MARHVGSGEAIGGRIAAARKGRGWTQAEFARRFGVSVRMLQYWESGKVVPYRYLERLADGFGCTSAWLLYGSDFAPETREVLRRSREEMSAQVHRLKENLETLHELREVAFELALSASTASASGAASAVDTASALRPRSHPAPPGRSRNRMRTSVP
jgi:transcriptional regulator with XRE-family HTH domain